MINFFYLVLFTTPIWVFILNFILLFLYYLFKFLYQYQSNLKMNNCTVGLNFTTATGHNFFIPSDYRITDLRSSLYFIWCLWIIIFTNSTFISTNRFIFYLYVFSLLFFLFLNLILLWQILFYYIYKECKKLYIYLLQFGGSLDLNSHYWKNTIPAQRLQKLSGSSIEFYLNRIYKYSFYCVCYPLTPILSSTLSSWDRMSKIEIFGL